MQRLEGKELIIATHNRGKVEEFATLLAPFGIEVRSAGYLGLAEPVEDGASFEENARIKAQACSEATGLPSLSDDSGLCVDALDGAPGIHTADWATTPEGGRDFAMAMEKVEQALNRAGASTRAQRGAKFVAVLCLARPGANTLFFRGEVAGELVWPPRGRKGFGFDPVFLPEGFDRTFGEMDAVEKHGWTPDGGKQPLSHRARAFASFAQNCLTRQP